MVYKWDQSRPKEIYAMLAKRRQMKQVAWIGQVDPQSGSLTPAGGVDQMVDMLNHSSPVPEEGQPDLRTLAKACSFVKEDGEYNRLLREVKVIYDYVSCHDKSFPKTFISPFKASSKKDLNKEFDKVTRFNPYEKDAIGFVSVVWLWENAA